MKDFPQLKMQEEIDREERSERWAEFAGDIIGGLAIVVLVIAGLFVGLGAGW